MSNKQWFWALLALVCFGCKEVPVPIPDLGVGSRTVLVEELSGVNCTNCPDGARELAKVRNSLGEDKMIVVTIYPSLYGILSRPYTDSKYDFRLKEGDDLVRYIGTADGIPAVAVNRVYVNQNAQNPFLLAQTQWGGAIRDQAQKAPEVGLFMETEFDPASRDLDVRLNIAPEKTLSGEHRLTVFITQDSIVDLQNDKGVKVPNYVHRHVLRKIITQPTGDVIAEPLTAKAVVSKEVSFNLPATWEAKHCAVVAFVHRNHSAPNDLEVLQAVEKKILK